MEPESYEIEASTPFADSKIWQLNRDFYQENGIKAWSEELVPFNMTSNSICAKTYADLIYALLEDLAEKGQLEETVYILELGAGHARLAYQIINHLEKTISKSLQELPSYCYVLSDIVEDNLTYFQSHPQLLQHYAEGRLDLSYFDAVSSDTLFLRHLEQTIVPNQLNQPVVAIANYFFDSLPNDLIHIGDGLVSNCSVAINSAEDPEAMSTVNMIDKMTFSYSKTAAPSPVYKNLILNEIVDDYKNTLNKTFLLFPQIGMLCLENIEALSASGMMLLTMDKGFHQLQKLKNQNVPEIITHGSLSLYVNYHALSAYCTKQGGKVFFPSFSNFHLEIGCLLFLRESNSYKNIDTAYHKSVNDFGPDDFNSIKQMAYANVSKLTLKELIALYRLSIYDSSFFVKVLPRLKQLVKTISMHERTRLGETLDFTWAMYFHINESFDLAYEIGGLCFDLAYYEKALVYFQHSVDIFGQKEDIYYNQALCYYQLRQDNHFYNTIKKAKVAYPGSGLYAKLDALKMD